MRRSVMGALLAGSVLMIGGLAMAGRGDDRWKPTPVVRSVDPETAKAGDVITLTGEFLDKSRVKEFYLTSGKDDFKTPLVEQNETTVKVKVPAEIKPGRLRVMILTAEIDPTFLEQPV